MARNLHHTKPRYIEYDRRLSDQRLSQRWRSDGDAQQAGSEFQITANVGPGETMISQERNNTAIPAVRMVERNGKTIEKHEFYEYEVTQYPQTGGTFRPIL